MAATQETCKTGGPNYTKRREKRKRKMKDRGSVSQIDRCIDRRNESLCKVGYEIGKVKKGIKVNKNQRLKN